MSFRRSATAWVGCAIAFGLLFAVAAVGGQRGGDTERDEALAQTQLATSESDAQSTPGGEGPAAPLGTDGPAPSPFWTKYAYFVPTQFSDLPGWRDDNLAEAWKAFSKSCNVLAARSAWSGPCARSFGVNARDSDAMRRFFEREFLLYQIHNKDRSPAGVITGYYEPLLRGGSHYGDRYVYPVYAMPEDLLYLDWRNIPRAVPGTPVFARVDGRVVMPVCTDPLTSPGCSGPYAIDIGDAKPDIRDKKLRVRIAGDRIVPYYTRAQIEQGLMVSARVIVWVDDAAALYSMQVQGSGKVRLEDGQVVRLAFAEQNGHPFIPPVQSAARRAPLAGTAVLTRGVPILLADPGSVAADEAADTDVSTQILLRSGPVDAVTERGANAPDSAAEQNMSPEVARMVELLLKGNTDLQQAPQVASSPSPIKKRPSSEAAPSVASPATSTATKLPASVTPSMFSSDPSYVFFRQIPDSDGGPPGALGVPLTPGRSVAVDPRTTPLGFPVFLSSEGQSVGTQLNRLMLAQDTGGAIRGAVRADYFWGFGPSAAERASRMKQIGRMWLLLPKDLRLTAGTASMGLRGISGPDASNADAECVVPDPELCVE